MGVEFLLSMRETLAEMVGRHYGRNPALLMPKMESTSDIPGGPNLMCCCARLPTLRWRSELGLERHGYRMPGSHPYSRAQRVRQSELARKVLGGHVVNSAARISAYSA